MKESLRKAIDEMLKGRSLAWKPLPLLSERNNTVLATVVISVTAHDSVTISF